MQDLTELRRIAEKATPGAWDRCDYRVFARDSGRLVTYGATNNSRRNDETLADMNYIATFDPKAVLALLDRLERAEGVLSMIREIAFFDPPHFRTKAMELVQEYQEARRE